MDSFQYDSYSSYSDASSGPRTPSPQSSLTRSPAHYKLDLEPAAMKPIFVTERLASDHGIDAVSHWQPTQVSYPGTPGSLLGELYEHDLPPQDQHVPDASYIYSHPPPQPQRVQHLQQEIGPMRRATYPYVRQEREDLAHYTIPPFLPTMEERRPQHSMLEHAPHQQLISLYELSGSPAQGFRELDAHVKIEDVGSPAIMPAQILYRSQSMDQMHLHHHHQQLPLLPHPPQPIQFTDDAASKETSVLRRRCTNCSQTEPPSWRRSTLNPGKIVCNKCGLYERTHLRPRPLRFDELRTGNKSRKGKKTGAIVKTELEPVPLLRRPSVSSTHSSDWDDSLSVGSSNSSAPSSSFNSPSPANFTIPLDRSSHSPTLLPNDGGIRLPNVDIASLSMHGSPQAVDFALQSNDYFTPQSSGSPALPLRADLSEVGTWQPMPGESSPGRHGPSILRKSVVA